MWWIRCMLRPRVLWSMCTETKKRGHGQSQSVFLWFWVMDRYGGFYRRGFGSSMCTIPWHDVRTDSWHASTLKQYKRMMVYAANIQIDKSLSAGACRWTLAMFGTVLTKSILYMHAFIHNRVCYVNAILSDGGIRFRAFSLMLLQMGSSACPFSPEAWLRVPDLGKLWTKLLFISLNVDRSIDRRAPTLAEIHPSGISLSPITVASMLLPRMPKTRERFIPFVRAPWSFSFFTVLCRHVAKWASIRRPKSRF
jgi:hypothetical protein